MYGFRFSRRIQPTRMKRMTFQDPYPGPPKGSPERVFQKRNANILGTGRRKTTGRWKKRRNPPLVAPDQRGDRVSHAFAFESPSRTSPRSLSNRVSRAGLRPIIIQNPLSRTQESLTASLNLRRILFRSWAFPSFRPTRNETRSSGWGL